MVVEEFKKRVKMAFYYRFDEIIPSIMAGEIDKICEELMPKVSQETKTEVKKVLDRVDGYTADKEVGMRYLLHEIAKEYGVTLKKPFKRYKEK